VTLERPPAWKPAKELLRWAAHATCAAWLLVCMQLAGGGCRSGGLVVLVGLVDGALHKYQQVPPAQEVDGLQAMQRKVGEDKVLQAGTPPSCSALGAGGCRRTRDIGKTNSRVQRPADVLPRLCDALSPCKLQRDCSAWRSNRADKRNPSRPRFIDPLHSSQACCHNE
jgi:hypothetical protein